MGSENRQTCNPDAATKGHKRKRYLPHNKPVKKKGSHPLRPGVQGFFITCDGGREHQASREALSIIESFYEELFHGEDSNVKQLPDKPLNTKITFSDSDSSSSDDDDAHEGEEEAQGEEEKGKKDNSDISNSNDDNANHGNETFEESDSHKIVDGQAQEEENADEPQAKKQCCKIDGPACDSDSKGQEKSIDRLIEAELKVLADKNKRCFVKLDSGCNGVVFVQMRMKYVGPGPKDIVQHMVTSAASTKKHMSRFILRILPIELACYASEEEISKAIKPLVECYFPLETQNPQKFAVLYEARANSGIDRMKIIDAVARSVPGPHKVDLKNPDKTIVVEIVKTVCLVGVIEKYKELAKYNIRQLTSTKG
ncbi:uncharacterized protein LOC129318430 isoform X2 [Prosopis cineraria]|uniref:uncharacterized protein LOC129318430 isoform X2 n=1 Tax=Prosopis cineraria TaxID=364024 RepID=UPI0024102636|nr:uncharacterized protein LOC129318430 isoform X2 [Prosopis cineraria]